MYSSSDFERLFIRYKAESVPQGESLQSFCLRNKVPYNLFHKWYKDTRHQLVPIQVEGLQSSLSSSASDSSVPPEVSPHSVSHSLKIMIDIRMSTAVCSPTSISS